MRYRTPTQLHASLYVRESSLTKKRSGSSKAGRNTKTGKFITIKEADRKKKQNSYIRKAVVFGCLFEQLKKFGQALTDNVGVAAYVYKISISAPARDNMDVQMVG